MRPVLLTLGATNLSGEECGFVYAKVPVALTKQDIESKIKLVWASADDAGVTIDLIDLDSTPDTSRTKFCTLWISS